MRKCNNGDACHLMRIFLDSCSFLHHAGERQSLMLTFLSDDISGLTHYPAAAMYGAGSAAV